MVIANLTTSSCVLTSAIILVSGDANFSMKHTGLTIGGFTQPFVARNLIDVQANVEKGLCQRFLWIVPEPNLVAYEQMCRVDEDFTTGIGEC